MAKADVRANGAASPVVHTPTVADRIGEMLAMYEMLNGEANRLIDQYVDEVAAPRCPGIPKGVVRALEIDNRIGGMLNYPEALRFLRQARA